MKQNYTFTQASLILKQVQLDVFDEQRESDESQAHSTLDGHGVDLNSHLDVFYAILNQV